MLRLNAARVFRYCDGTTRRDFLTVGTLGLGAMALPQLLAAALRRQKRAGQPRTLRSSGCGSPAGRRTSKPSTRRWTRRQGTAV